MQESREAMDTQILYAPSSFSKRLISAMGEAEIVVNVHAFDPPRCPSRLSRAEAALAALDDLPTPLSHTKVCKKSAASGLGISNQVGPF